MRLLQTTITEEISLTEDLLDHKLPPYAILSHTWGDPRDEVTFDDLQSGSAKDKPGYEKLRFCLQQAHRDGYSYCWVDTCCINKDSTAELSESLISMFRWYAAAQKCYAYLSDVGSEQDWIIPFKKSKWFTRGWTLQELIAPKVVEFYTKNGKRIASKETHTSLISEITHLPTRALKDFDFSHFTVDERLQWQYGRSTTRDEDMVYSLLGLLNISMPVLYGERREKAQTRLHAALRARGGANGDYSLDFDIRTMAKSHCFVGREEELESIRKWLSSDSSSRTIWIQGMAGTGKSTLAREYARRHRNDYSAVFWMDAKDEDSVKRSYYEAYRRIRKRYPKTMGQSDNPVIAVKNWLSLYSNTGWLLICDNYNTPSNKDDSNTFALDEYLPDAYHGSVIVTSQCSNVKLKGAIYMPLSKLRNDTDSLTIIAEEARRPQLRKDPYAKELIARLDGLPLALASAGAYLRNTSLGFKQYAELFDHSWADLQKHTPSLDFYDRTLYSTWQMSYEVIQKEDPNAAMLLKLWAYLDDSDVWLELLQSGAHMAPWLEEVTSSQWSFDKTMRLLCDRGLVQPIDGLPLSESCGYGMHHCVHAWIKDVVSPTFDESLARLATTCVSSHVSSEEIKSHSLINRRLLSHANVCFTYYDKLMVSDEIMMACDKLALLCHDVGKAQQAMTLLEYTYVHWCEMLGPTHKRTLITAFLLGSVYTAVLKLDDAEDLFAQTLITHPPADECDAQLLVELKYGLSNVYKLQGNLESEEKLVREALRESMAKFGPLHHATLLLKIRLAVVCISCERYEEAMGLSQEARLASLELHGEDNLHYMMTLFNIAVIQAHTNKAEESSVILQKVLALSEGTFGQEHAFTVRTKAELGNCLVRLGRYDAARRLLENVVEYPQRLPPATELTFWEVLCNLAMVSGSRNGLDKTEAIYSKALRSRAKDARLVALYHIGRVHVKQQRHRVAEESWRMWQDEHDQGDDTISVRLLSWLEKTYQQQERWQEAEHQYRKYLEGVEKLYGAQAEWTNIVAGELASILINQDQAEDAEPSIHSMVALAASYKRVKRWQDSEFMYRRALDGYERDRGADYFLVFTTMNDLALLLAEHGNDREAEDLFTQALSGLRKCEEDTTQYMLAVAINLAFLKTRQEKHVEAKLLLTQVMQYSTQTPFPHYQELAVRKLHILLKGQSKHTVSGFYGCELIQSIAQPPSAAIWNAYTTMYPWWKSIDR